jgi:hypothetical protein
VTTWYRVFGTSDTEPAPAALLEHLQSVAPGAGAHFRGDDQGWFEAELSCGGPAPLRLERFLASEEDIRAELNNWAAWIESTGDGPGQVRLMQHMISTRQLFTLRPSGGAGAQVAVAVCRYLAGATEGVYQVDNQGFFAPDGTLLLSESV